MLRNNAISLKKFISPKSFIEEKLKCENHKLNITNELFFYEILLYIDVTYFVLFLQNIYIFALNILKCAYLISTQLLPYRKVVLVNRLQKFMLSFYLKLS